MPCVAGLDAAILTPFPRVSTGNFVHAAMTWTWPIPGSPSPTWRSRERRRNRSRRRKPPSPWRRASAEGSERIPSNPSIVRRRSRTQPAQLGSRSGRHQGMAPPSTWTACVVESHPLELEVLRGSPVLGGRSTVGHVALDHVIGVRIPASQPAFAHASRELRLGKQIPDIRSERTVGEGCLAEARAGVRGEPEARAKADPRHRLEPSHATTLSSRLLIPSSKPSCEMIASIKPP
jgi:hypothetical protein